MKKADNVRKKTEWEVGKKFNNLVQIKKLLKWVKNPNIVGFTETRKTLN